MARQKILDVNNNLLAYELLFRDSETEINEFPANLKATSHVVMNVLSNVDMSTIIPSKIRAHINIDGTVLLSGIIDILDRAIFTLELVGSTELNEKIVNKIKHYHEMGFKIAIDSFDCSSEMITKYKSILKYITLIKVDLKSSNLKNLKKLMPTFKDMGKQICAVKIETEEEYVLCKKIGFDLFQGYLFDKPHTIKIPIYKEASHIVILQLIGLLKDDASITIVRKFIQSRPDLSIKLIRYLNNQNNFITDISSITQVITLMGRDSLKRWLLLYLYSEVSTTPISENVLMLAQARAEKLEELAPDDMKDKAYLSGMFSMLDVLFEADMSDIIKGIQLDPEIVNLVIHKKGKLAASLNEIMDDERADLKEITCDNFDKLRIEDILYALEFANVPLVEKTVT
jgi:EAL and modified HD-GYP domain-containing signal transduction protein